MALTLPVSVDAVAYTAAATATGITNDMPLVKTILKQDACMYKGSHVLESEDVDMVGNLVKREKVVKK